MYTVLLSMYISGVRVYQHPDARYFNAADGDAPDSAGF